MARDELAKRRATTRRDLGDGSIEEALRQLGAEILAEPVPERLRQVLRQAEAPDQEPGPRPDDVPDEPSTPD